MTYNVFSGTLNPTHFTPYFSILLLLSTHISQITIEIAFLTVTTFSDTFLALSLHTVLHLITSLFYENNPSLLPTPSRLISPSNYTDIDSFLTDCNLLD